MLKFRTFSTNLIRNNNRVITKPLSKFNTNVNNDSTASVSPNNNNEFTKSNSPQIQAQSPVQVQISDDDWSKSFSGLSTQRVSNEIEAILMQPVDPIDVEVKPGLLIPLFNCSLLNSFMLDGLIYLPEIKYRRILNKAFGPGGWGLAPRTSVQVDSRIVSREYALVCNGRLA